MNKIEAIEDLIQASINRGEFRNITDAEAAVRAWLDHRGKTDLPRAKSLEGDMTESGDAEYQDQAMRSVDA